MKFSDAPGMRERQLMRRYNNPLFTVNEVTMDELQNAQREDIREAEDFMKEFRDLVQQAVDLDENSDPDVILKLKEQLDKNYEKCAGLAGDQTEIKEMLNRLIKAIMQVMWKGIGNDSMARSKLEMEEQARSSHFALLEYKIITDILRPDSVIEENDLLATLLSEEKETLKVALQLFQPEQQAVLYKMAEQAISRLDKQYSLFQSLEDKLIEMRNMLKAVNEMPL